MPNSELIYLIAVPVGMIAVAIISWKLGQYFEKKDRNNWQEIYLELYDLQHDMVRDAKEEGRIAAMDDARRLMKKQEKEMRADSVKKSKAVTIGKIAEQFAPYLPGWNWNPKDARFLGSPMDFIIFDGMEEGAIREIVIVEIKTGKSRLSAREQDLQDVVGFRRIRYEVLRI